MNDYPKVYLAGPMRGIPHFNFPAFMEAAEKLRARGYEVWNPAEVDVQIDGMEHKPQGDTNAYPKPFRFYMQRDLPAVMDSDIVATLPGWENSKGAKLEVRVARECGILVVPYTELLWYFGNPLHRVTMNADPMIGPGGAPTRATTLPESAAERKNFPVATGFLDYFPDAIVAVAEVSKKGNDQHNPGKSLRWDRSKSADESDTVARHFLQRGTRDTDGLRHSAKLAWRALALLQKEIEAERDGRSACSLCGAPLHAAPRNPPSPDQHGSVLKACGLKF